MSLARTYTPLSEKRVTVAARLDDGTYQSPLEILVPPGWHAVELDWKASDGPGQDDGFVDIWLDDAAQAGLSGLDNDTGQIDFVRWGAVDEIESDSSGTMDLDGFASGRSFKIGLGQVSAGPSEARASEPASNEVPRGQVQQLPLGEIRGARRSRA